MFDVISKYLRKHLLTPKNIERILERTADKYLCPNYNYTILDTIPSELLDAYSEFQSVDEPEDITGITFASAEIDSDGSCGDVWFSVRAIQKGLEDFGLLEGIEIVWEIALHECRHADQFEFLRARGGSELIGRVMEDQKGVPYMENILEVDAYHYQFTGEETDFEIVFARYL